MLRKKTVDYKTGVTTFDPAFAVGLVVATFSKFERIMSDVWDDVWYAVYEDKDGTWKKVHTGCSEFGLTYEATVDASPSLKAKYEDYLARCEYADREREREAAAYAAKLRLEADAKVIARGKTVKVVKGRKVPVGTVGEVIWVGDGTWGTRVGIGVGDTFDARGHYTNVVWTAASNCEVVGWKKFLPVSNSVDDNEGEAWAS